MDDLWKTLMVGAIAVIAALLALVWQSSRVNYADCKDRIGVLEKDRLHISGMAARLVLHTKVFEIARIIAHGSCWEHTDICAQHEGICPNCQQVTWLQIEVCGGADELYKLLGGYGISSPDKSLEKLV